MIPFPSLPHESNITGGLLTDGSQPAAAAKARGRFPASTIQFGHAAINDQN